MRRPQNRWPIAACLMLAALWPPAAGADPDAAAASRTDHAPGVLAWSVQRLSSEHCPISQLRTHLVAGWRLPALQLGFSAELQQLELAPLLRASDTLQLRARASAWAATGLFQPLESFGFRLRTAVHAAVVVARGPLDRTLVTEPVRLRSDAAASVVYQPRADLVLVADAGLRGKETSGAPWLERTSLFAAFQMMGVF